MPENESSPSTSANVEATPPTAGTLALAPQPAAATPVAVPEPPFWLNRKWKAPWLATLGAAFGALIGSGLHGEVFSDESHHGDFMMFLLVAFIIGSAAYWFFDPMMELVQGWMGIPPREIPQERRVATTLAVVATTLVISVLHHSLATSLEKVHTVGFVLLLLFYGCTAGVTTHSWLYGAKKSPSRSAAYGARNGGLGGAAAGFLLTALIIIFRPSTTHGLTSADLADLAQNTGIWAGLTVLPGFLGGMAIERKWDPKSPSRGVLYAMIAFSGLLFFVAMLLGELVPGKKETLWLIAFQSISLSMGWALGLFLQRESCDELFDPNWRMETVAPETHGRGTVVVPIDTRRPVEPAQAAAVAASEPRTSAQELILRPKGSRAWALGLLVIALAAGAWAYTTGALRSDPELISEIEGKFAQDSGLHGKSLTAGSANHIVTLAGMVDNPFQHTAAVQHASEVRGVKQVVDQIQVAPPPAPKPKVAAVQQQQQPTTNINASFSIGGGSGQTVSVRKQTRRTTPAPSANTKKRGGLFHFFRRNK